MTAPINARSLRDAYAFKQHVETSRKNRGLKMIKEFDLSEFGSGIYYVQVISSADTSVRKVVVQ